MLMWVHTRKGCLYEGAFLFSRGRAGAMQFYCVPDGETSASYIFFNAPLQLGAAQLLPPLSARCCAASAIAGA